MFNEISFVAIEHFSDTLVEILAIFSDQEEGTGYRP